MKKDSSCYLQFLHWAPCLHPPKEEQATMTDEENVP